MTASIYVKIFLLLMSIAVSSSLDVTSASMGKMEQLEAKIEQMERRHHAEIRAINEKVDQQHMEILDLKETISQKDIQCTQKVLHIAERLTRIEGKHKELDEDDKTHKMKTATTTGDMIESKKEKQLNIQATYPSRIKEDNREPNLDSAERVRPERELIGEHRIAFSTYLDHTVDGLGPGQTIMFNQILLNDANGYNKHTGVFTAPVTGVYSFSFFIGERGNTEEWAELWVNDQNIIDAVVQTTFGSHDGQGGNAANLRLKQDDVVFVKNRGNGHLAGGQAFGRHTTFSGFLIYAVETPDVIGK